jgi:hypothetical protein
MSKKSKKKGAESLQSQARMHEALYGPDWGEVGEYRGQALGIIERYAISIDEKKIDSEGAKLFKKRLEEFGTGKRKMVGELPFAKVLRVLKAGGTIDKKDAVLSQNLALLEGLGYVKDGKLTGKGRQLLSKIAE